MMVLSYVAGGETKTLEKKGKRILLFPFRKKKKEKRKGGGGELFLGMTPFGEEEERD